MPVWSWALELEPFLQKSQGWVASPVVTVFSLTFPS